MQSAYSFADLFLSVFLLIRCASNTVVETATAQPSAGTSLPSPLPPTSTPEPTSSAAPTLAPLPTAPSTPVQPLPEIPPNGRFVLQLLSK